MILKCFRSTVGMMPHVKDSQAGYRHSGTECIFGINFCKFLTFDTPKLERGKKKCTSIDTHNLEFDP